MKITVESIYNIGDTLYIEKKGKILLYKIIDVYYSGKTEQIYYDIWNPSAGTESISETVAIDSYNEDPLVVLDKALKSLE
jgi:hypothetical protein|nr:MAG TPA: hypothetical protein [Caudoviricetes sp.]